MIALDLRGHGRSLAGSAGFGLSRLADDLALLLEHLDLEGAVVVGHSMGGMTAMQFAAEHPDVLDQRVDGLVFVATRAHQVLPPYVVDGARHLVGRGQAMVDEGRQLPARANLTEQLARLAFGDHPSPKAVAQVAEMGRSMEHEALVPSVAGLLVSYHFDVPASPAIILAAGACYLFSIVGGPQGGLLRAARRVRPA